MLFRQFCESRRPRYHHCLNFLDSVEEYELESDGNRSDLAHKIKSKFFSGDSDIVKLANLNTETINQCFEKLGNGNKDLFQPCVANVKQCLADEPFKDFENSIHFLRYLQWKWLEAQPVTYKTFRMYRVLGKGGFGEVCACQVSHYIFCSCLEIN